MSMAALSGGAAVPSGTVALRVIRRSGVDWPHKELSPNEIDYYGMPQKDLPVEINAWRRANKKNLQRGMRDVLTARKFKLPHFYGQLWLSKISRDGERTDLGLASLRVVTTVGVNFIVDAFQNIKEVEDMKFHGLGTGAGAEAVGDTILNAELTTAYNNGGDLRATGTLTEGASANIYRTVATNTVDAAVAVTEHGIFSQAATGAASGTNVLLDRSLFAAVNLAIGDQLQSTYDLTIAAGG